MQQVLDNEAYRNTTLEQFDDVTYVYDDVTYATGTGQRGVPQHNTRAVPKAAQVQPKFHLQLRPSYVRRHLERQVSSYI